MKWERRPLWLDFARSLLCETHCSETGYCEHRSHKQKNLHFFHVFMFLSVRQIFELRQRCGRIWILSWILIIFIISDLQPFLSPARESVTLILVTKFSLSFPIGLSKTVLYHPKRNYWRSGTVAIVFTNRACSLIAKPTILSRPQNVGVFYNITALMEHFVHTCQLVEQFEWGHTHIYIIHKHTHTHTEAHTHAHTYTHTGTQRRTLTHT